MSNEYGAKMSVIYNFSGSILSKIITIATSILLARILFPEDYGYLVIAFIFEGFFGLFSISGFETYYIQKRDVKNTDEDMYILGVCWKLRLRQSIILFLIQIFVSVLLYIYRDPILGKMIFTLSFLHVLNIIGRPREAYASKLLNFKPIAQSNALSDIVTSLTKIIFALLGFGPLSFVFGQVLGAVSKGMFIVMKVKINIKSIKDSILSKEVMRFGRSVFFNSAGAYLMQQTDRIFITSYYPLAASGIYQFSKNQGAWLNNFILYPQNSLAMSYLSKKKDNPIELMAKLKSAGNLIGGFVTPIFILIFIYADWFILSVFGIKWIEAAPIMRVFLFYYYFQFIMYPTNGILTALGKPEIKAKISWSLFIIIALALLLISYYQISIIWYALTFVISYTILDIVIGWKGVNLLGYSYLEFIAARFTSYLFIILCSSLFYGIIKLSVLSLTLRLILSTLGYFMLLIFCYKLVFKSSWRADIIEVTGEKLIIKLDKYL